MNIDQKKQYNEMRAALKKIAVAPSARSIAQGYADIYEAEDAVGLKLDMIRADAKAALVGTKPIPKDG